MARVVHSLSAAVWRSAKCACAVHSVANALLLCGARAVWSVFCKLGQTLATRPDIIGLETSRNLGQLQDAIAPESAGPQLAMATLEAALGCDVSTKLANITSEPVAAASLAEVYRATTVADGRPVAVKIQRPGLERKVRAAPGDGSPLASAIARSSSVPRDHDHVSRRHGHTHTQPYPWRRVILAPLVECHSPPCPGRGTYACMRVCACACAHARVRMRVRPRG